MGADAGGGSARGNAAFAATSPLRSLRGDPFLGTPKQSSGIATARFAHLAMT
jgi:hypothetical protein